MTKAGRIFPRQKFFVDKRGVLGDNNIYKYVRACFKNHKHRLFALFGRICVQKPWLSRKKPQETLAAFRGFLTQKVPF